MLDIDALADAIKSALGNPVDKDGNPIAATNEMKKYAEAVVTTLQAGIVANATGTVTATGVPATPIADGAAAGGLVSGLLAATWLGIMAAANPTANPVQLSAEATASTAYLMASSVVSFATGKITGNCTATPVAPGPLLLGAGVDGEISGLSGSPWSSAVMAALGGGGPLGEAVYDAIANHIIGNAKCAYASGAVTGAFAAAGGPMTLGTGLVGTIQ